tara:strand:+ start:626 stop:751 length:126 start_codon:yes stop_codon:yes gene_type:complete
MTEKDWVNVCTKCWQYFPNGLDKDDHCEDCAISIKEEEESK